MSLPLRPEDDPRPQPPERPDDNACCQSGCDPCIFDLYNDEVTRYRANLAVWERREAQRQASTADATDAAKTAKAEKAAG
ncbi:oxidoreductase-like domain-containing protein [Burkholderia sp. Ax-1719]|uniref:oxidoreductase-like domain-containing protein n=1 Tax=Burkholderia sp. Ax-1719 TaxID=2608334 RepID=UPI00141F8129|nr:oxidoreductase-like domain-containing protein [Burkholderia sp. Ax-1719]NIE68937.1 oxidoreductase [Burkholderia sp. Ax-1719]